MLHITLMFDLPKLDYKWPPYPNWIVRVDPVFLTAMQVSKLDEIFKDNKWHIVRLIVNPDQTYEIDLDRKTVGKGSLLEDFNPPVNPPKEIEDPNDSKPDDWD